jgi:rod shape-determining protein MreB
LGLFDFLKTELAIDPGSRTMRFVSNDKIVQQPSRVAVREKTGEVVALGDEATDHSADKIVRPINATIADYRYFEELVGGLMSQAEGKKFIEPTYKMVFAVPNGSSEVEKRAYRDSAEHCGASEINLVPQAIAALLGLGVELEGNKGVMIIDIGARKTEISIVSEYGILANKLYRIGGEDFTNDLRYYLKRENGLNIDQDYAEKIKKNIGEVGSGGKVETQREFKISNTELLQKQEKNPTITNTVVAERFEKYFQIFEEAILELLETVPFNVTENIMESGLIVVGGSANIPGVAKRLSLDQKLKVSVPKNADLSVTYGLMNILKDRDKYRKYYFETVDGDDD